MKHDLVAYPPMQSLIVALRELDMEVVFIGKCSDCYQKSYYEKMGVIFEPIIYTTYVRAYKILNEQRTYRKKIAKYLKEAYSITNDIVWFEYSDMAYFVHDILVNTNYLIHFYEFFNTNCSWKYQLIYSSYNMSKFVQGAKAVVHCEYNRAHITRGLCDLKELPFVLPNKPYPENKNLESAPMEVVAMVNSLKQKLKGKKVILYQGVFESSERRLEEFCEAIQCLPKDYAFVAMGGGSRYYDDLKQYYESDRIIFVPFIKSPYHLLVTQLADLGILSYFPLNGSYAGVLNPLFCAPNKIFEYGKFGIPMLSNDLPGLKTIYDNFHCGQIVPYPITSESIKNVLLNIFENHNELAEGAYRFYNSVDFKLIVNKILQRLDLLDVS